MKNKLRCVSDVMNMITNAIATH